MKIYLVRHGIAYEPGEPGYEDDAQRPLTDKGRDKMKKVAHVLKRLGVQPDVMVSSPYLRARQTAEILAKELKYKKDKLVFSDRLLPTAQPGLIIAEMIEKYMVEELMVIGHEPCLGLLIGALASGGGDLSINVKYGSVCCLSADDFRIERRATLEWLLTPKIAAKT
ncbi:MAG TPA: phosphohistidine phosphatase SixA [Anaerolineales bacterium]|nr:phosphohistidine phosphatase SixA [Anaerolineales bacterium]